MHGGTSIRDQILRRIGKEVLTEEDARRFGVWGLHFGTLIGRSGINARCDECGAEWFHRGLHNHDCSQIPRRLPPGFKVKVSC